MFFRVLIIVFLFSSELLFAQGPQQMFWALNTNGIYLLDQIGRTNSSVAYSVRKLRRNYTGYSMRVRRSGDNAIGDVNFDVTGVVSATSTIRISSAGSGSLTVGSTISYSTFYSGRNVFVVAWYDQSGNSRDVTQGTTGQQPRVVNSGTLETSNSIASVRFINSNSTVLSASIPSASMFSSSYIGTASIVLEASSGNTSSFGYSDGGTNRWQAHMNESSNLHFDVGNSYNRLTFVNSTGSGVLRTYALVAGPSLMQIWRSGSNVASSTPTMSTSTTSTFYLGAIPTFPGTWYHNNDISELVIFPTALTSSEIGILNTNQKNFYGTP